MALGPWESAALEYELTIFRGDLNSSACFIGGLVQGMSIATNHPEYAKAAAYMSQQEYTRERPDHEQLDEAVKKFIQAVPIKLHDEEPNG